MNRKDNQHADYVRDGAWRSRGLFTQRLKPVPYASVSSSVAAFLVGGLQSVLVWPRSIEASLGYGCASQRAATKWFETVSLAMGLTSQDGFTVKPVAILLIEDNPGDTRLVAEALKACPVPVELTVAADGETALSLLRKEESKPDLVILDLNIPKVSGISVLEQYVPKQSPPVVVFSSTWGQTEIRRALELGAREVVHKPIEIHAFIDAVCGIVHKWAARG